MRWGVAGPGRIAAPVAGDFAFVVDAELVAVGSRSAEWAQAFAEQHGIARSYGSYADLVRSDDLDVIYFATPHPQHMAIGEVRAVQADLGVDRRFDPTDRLFDPAQGGGALLDLGVYVVSFAQHFLGTPDRVTASGSLAPTGVDLVAGLLLSYDDGRCAPLLASLATRPRAARASSARVVGSTARRPIDPRGGGCPARRDLRRGPQRQAHSCTEPEWACPVATG